MKYLSSLLKTINFVFIFVLIFLGFFIHQQGMNLDCTEWPLCYPYQKSLGWNESSLILSFILFIFSFFLFVLGFKNKNPKEMFPFFVFIFYQLFGFMSSYYHGPTLMKVIHYLLGLGSAFFLIRCFQFKIVKTLFETRIRDHFFLFFFFFIILLFLEALRFYTGEFSQTGRGQLLELHQVLSGLFIFFFLLLMIRYFRLIYQQIGKVLLATFLIIGLLYSLSLIVMVSSKPQEDFLLLHFLLQMIFFFLFSSFVYSLIQSEPSIEVRPGYLTDFLLLTKARLSLLVMLTVFVGIVIAPFELDFLRTFFIFSGISLLAMGATSLNCVLEIEEDKLMERTKNRPLPSGRMKPTKAIFIGILLSILGMVLIYFWANLLTLSLGLLALISYLFVYTPLKHKSPFAVYVGALPGALPPLMGWTAVTNQIEGLGLFLFIFLFVWQIPHFFAISAYRFEDYKKANFPTYYSKNGDQFLVWSIVLGTIFLSALSFFPYQGNEWGSLYHTVSIILAALFFGISLQGFKAHSKEAIVSWARVYFFATIIYLPLQLVALVFLIP